MKATNLNQGWSFTEGMISNIPMMHKEATPVNLPHDYMVLQDVDKSAACGNEGGYYPGGCGTYDRTLKLTEEEMTDVMELAFEGSFGKTQVLVNGRPAGHHTYGYTPFTLNIRPLVQVGENKIRVIVNHDDMPNARWYTGAGLYRGVQLLTAGEVYIPENGVYVYTHRVTNGDAFLKSEVTVCNEQGAGTGNTEVFLQYEVVEKATGNVAASRVQKAMIPAHKNQVISQNIMVEDAKLWSVNAPQLYELHVRLAVLNTDAVKMSVGNRENLTEQANYVDEASATFGIRTISADAKNGLLINGESVKMKGGCIHHDNGMLGACSLYDAEYRKVKLHKENGYNALRLAHNPQSSQLLDICDELGMLVIDEAYDVWNVGKNAYDFSNEFAQEWEKELTSILLRDRNHASVIFWSIGNELPEQGGMAQGYETSHMLAEHVRRYDRSRLVCGALCSFFRGLDEEDNNKFWQAMMQEAKPGTSFVNMDNSFGKAVWPEYTGPFASDWDMVGYNYLSYHFETSHEMFPDRVMCTTESKACEQEAYWEDVKRLPYVIGDFMWTSHDYIGEAGIGKRFYVDPEQAPKMAQMLNYTTYPYRLAGAGDFDLCGFMKPQAAYHRIIWGSDETYIFSRNPENEGKVELVGRYGWPEGGHHWNWNVEDGRDARIEVYSGAEEVELFLNGSSLGRKPAGTGNHYKAEFVFPFAKGELVAVSYAAGVEVSRDQVATCGAPEGLRITMEQSQTLANGEALAYGTVEIVDADGNYIETAEDVLATATVTGCASLAAFGNGRVATEENYSTGSFTSYEGRWQVIVRSGCETGTAEVTVETEQFGSVQAEITVR